MGVIATSLLLLLAIPFGQTPAVAADGGAALTDTGVRLPGAGAVACADCDGDGDLDLAVAGSTARGAVTAIYRNDGNGIFVDIAAGLEPAWSADVLWADIDGDADADLIVAGQTDRGPAVHVYRNRDGAFDRATTFLPGAPFVSLAACDVNNDGRRELTMAGGNRLELYGVDGGILATHIWHFGGIQHGDAGWADINGDGRRDLLAVGEYNTGFAHRPTSALYINNADASFTTIEHPTEPLSAAAIDWADYDNDGDPDLAVAGFGDDGATTMIYRNDRGRLVPLNVSLLGLGDGDIAWGDFDNDGDRDLFVTGALYFDAEPRCAARLYRNDGRDVFTSVAVDVDGIRGGGAAWGDFDGDGDLDLAVSGTCCDGGMGTRIYKNEARFANTPPRPPTGLAAFSDDSGIVFTWRPADDAETPAAGLSYRLWLTYNGNTRPRLAQIDGVGTSQPTAGRQSFITWLCQGCYGAMPDAWSVQAVDAAGRVSSRSASQIIAASRD